MDFFFTTLKKILTFSLSLAFVTAFVYVPQFYGEHETVPVAEAQFAVAESGPVGAAIIGDTIFQANKEITLDAIAWTVAKVVVSNIVQSTVTWISNGFQGSPAFVQDLDRYLIDVADQAAGTFISSLGPGNPLSFVCSPFALDIQASLAIQYQTARERLPYQGCRISDFTGDFEQFIDGNFRQGGWDSFFRVVAEPQVYTPIGARGAAQQALQQNIQAEQAAENQTVANSGGFLSFKLCENVTGAGGASQRSCRIVTPGKTIADRLSSSLGLSEQTLITADEVNEIVGALIGQIAVQAITGTAGLLGLSGGGGFSYNGFNAGSFIDAVGQENTDFGNGEFNVDLENLQSNAGNAGNAVDATLADLEEILDRQEDFLASARFYQSRFETVLQDDDLSNTDRQRVEDALEEIEDRINEIILDHVGPLSLNVDEYAAIVGQTGSGQLSATQIQSARDRQLEILEDVLASDHFTQAEIDAIIAEWEALLDRVT